MLLGGVPCCPEKYFILVVACCTEEYHTARRSTMLPGGVLNSRSSILPGGLSYRPEEYHASRSTILPVVLY